MRESSALVDACNAPEVLLVDVSEAPCDLSPGLRASLASDGEPVRLPLLLVERADPLHVIAKLAMLASTRVTVLTSLTFAASLIRLMKPF